MKLKTMNKLIAVSVLTLLSTTTRAESVYMCEPCPAGYSCNNGIKTICPAGTFATVGAKSCTNCSDGTYSNEGASSCSSCPEGYTANSSHTGCAPSPCSYSFDTPEVKTTYCKLSGKAANTGFVISKKGLKFNSYKCQEYTCVSGSNSGRSTVCSFQITLEHGDSVNGKTCYNGVMK